MSTAATTASTATATTPTTSPTLTTTMNRRSAQDVEARVKRSALGTALAILTFVGASAAHAQECSPPAHDCAAAGAAAEASITAVPDDSRASAAFVASYRVSACRARLACLVSDGDLQRVEAWADAELRAARELTDARARATWRSGLTNRVPGLRIPGAVLVPSALPSPSANPAILEQVVRLRDELELMRRFDRLLDDVERGTRLPRDGSTPAACRGDLRDRLQALIREGTTNGSHASSLRAKLDNLCARFAGWERPTETVEGRLLSFVARVHRVEGFLNDVIRCYEPGPYDGRCRNTFGDSRPDGVAQARAALREVAQVRRVIRDVPGRPFPCRDAIWERLVATRWTLRTAEAQIPSLGRAAISVCEVIGVLPRELERTQRDLTDTLEQIRAQVAQSRQNTQMSLQQIRTLYRLD